MLYLIAVIFMLAILFQMIRMHQENEKQKLVIERQDLSIKLDKKDYVIQKINRIVNMDKLKIKGMKEFELGALVDNERGKILEDIVRNTLIEENASRDEDDNLVITLTGYYINKPGHKPTEIL
jgi:hypothetical protein